MSGLSLSELQFWKPGLVEKQNGKVGGTMKKLIKLGFCLISTVLIIQLSGCQKSSSSAPAEQDKEKNKKISEEKIELIVFAAASMTETLEEISRAYQKIAPDVTLIYTFDSSGTLKTQIQEGAECDIFISAAQKQMDQLDKAADPKVNTEGLDYILEGSRFNLVKNKVVLAVPEGNPAQITSYEDLKTDKLNLIALGNLDVPVGAYSEEILDYLGIRNDLEQSAKISYASNVKEVTTQIAEHAVDCGIIYATDAFSAGLSIVDEADTTMCSQAVYPAAVLKQTKNPDAAQAFLFYLKTEDCAEIFESVGFSMAEE